MLYAKLLLVNCQTKDTTLQKSPLNSEADKNGGIFCSYSRKDSGFVLKLARDLKTRGIILWIDQYGIRPGQRWDSSIEAALISASFVIVFLSPTSIMSENVLDEVSFALHYKKTIIPLLVSKCEVPLRLQRLQRIDFTQNYESGLNNLLKELNDNSAVDGKKNGTKFYLKKNIFWIAGIVFIALITWFIISLNSGSANDSQTWNSALNKNDSSAFELYLQKFPKGIYAIIAKEKIDSIHRSSLNSKNRVPENVGGLNITNKINDKQSANKTADSKQLKELSIRKDPGRNTNKTDLSKKTITLKKNIYENNDNSNIVIGGKFEGGIIFYIDASGKHGLIAAPFDQSSAIAWWDGVDVDRLRRLKTSEAMGTGKENTDAIVASEDTNRDNPNYAARLCADLNLNGYQDWYLPSKDEADTLMSKINLVGGFVRNNVYWTSSGNINGALVAQIDGSNHDCGLRFDIPSVRAIRSF